MWHRCCPSVTGSDPGCFLLSSPAGHLLSTAEVESALVEHEAVAEAAVVGRPHPVKGESLYCFVTLSEGVTFSRTLEAELRRQGGLLWPIGCLSPMYTHMVAVWWSICRGSQSSRPV